MASLDYYSKGQKTPMSPEGKIIPMCITIVVRWDLTKSDGKKPDYPSWAYESKSAQI